MFELVLGHLVGDYLLQNEWMALNKSKNTKLGWLTAFVHCILYTVAVCLVMWNFDWYWAVAVFLSHFPIDKFSLGERYLHYIKGKSLKDYVNKDGVWDGIIYAPKPFEKQNLNRFDVLEGAFTAVVYTVTDNTMHLILMYGAYQILY